MLLRGAGRVSLFPLVRTHAHLPRVTFPVVAHPEDQPSARKQPRPVLSVHVAKYGSWCYDRRMNQTERFWIKVGMGPDDCWLWLGAKSPEGYGFIRWDNKSNRGAHRVSWEIAHGPIPSGLVIDHLCRHPWCVNPDHLEPVTPSENIKRGDPRRNYVRGTRCGKGHELSGHNAMWRKDRPCAECRECARLATIARKNTI